ncbi:MAG TPA: hypothetical protein VH989_08185 [Actinomycetota bacterium]|jgi:hypothetical protein
MARVDRLRAFASCSIATLGVVFGHAVTYVLIEPNAHDRNVLLTSTGHGYLPAFAETALVAAGLAFMWLFLSRLHHPSNDLPTLPGLAVGLSTIQVAIFATMEVLERIEAHAGMHGLARVLFTGLVVQAVIATLGALVIRALLRAGSRIALAPSLPPRPRLRTTPIAVPAQPPRRTSPHLPATGLRGPPSARSFV